MSSPILLVGVGGTKRLLILDAYGKRCRLMSPETTRKQTRVLCHCKHRMCQLSSKSSQTWLIREVIVKSPLVLLVHASFTFNVLLDSIYVQHVRSSSSRTWQTRDAVLYHFGRLYRVHCSSSWIWMTKKRSFSLFSLHSSCVRQLSSGDPRANVLTASKVLVVTFASYF